MSSEHVDALSMKVDMICVLTRTGRLRDDVGRLKAAITILNNRLRCQENHSGEQDELAVNFAESIDFFTSKISELCEITTKLSKEQVLLNEKIDNLFKSFKQSECDALVDSDY